MSTGAKYARAMAQTLKDFNNKVEAAVKKNRENLERINTTYAGDTRHEKELAERESKEAALVAARSSFKSGLEENYSKLIEWLEDIATTPCDVAALATIQAMSSRTVTQTELDSMVRRYGTNYQASQLLASIAQKNGLAGALVAQDIRQGIMSSEEETPLELEYLVNDAKSLKTMISGTAADYEGHELNSALGDDIASKFAEKLASDCDRFEAAFGA